MWENFNSLEIRKILNIGLLLNTFEENKLLNYYYY